MLKVLFVDDEPYVLESLRDMLRPLRHRMSLTFATRASEALELLEADPADMVVTDMRMPDMDGAHLLRELRLRHPHIMRAVLTGQGDQASAEKLLPVAQQMILKPCEKGRLEEVLTRAERIATLLPEPSVRACVGRVASLPPAPRLYAKLVRTMESGDASAKDIARIIGSDTVMSAKLLQLANSSFFRLARQITTVEDAVVHLGFTTIRTLVLTVEVFEASQPLAPSSGLSVERLHSHAILVARIASRICPAHLPSQMAFLAGVLHGIGLLVLGVGAPSEMRKALELAANQNLTLAEATHNVFGATHARAGAYLLGLWGLPLDLMQAVATHVDPPHRTHQRPMDLGLVLHLAHGLANGRKTVSSLLAPREALDASSLSAFGAQSHVDRWRLMAEEEAAVL